MHPAQTIVQLYEQLAERPDDEHLRVRDGYALAAQLFAGRYRASGRTFVSHLVGTASALVDDAAPIDVVLAGLLHAAYPQGVFPGRHSRRRAQVRSAIGAAAEEWVHGYAHFDWAGADFAPGAVDPELVRIRVANEIDECAGGALRYCSARRRRAVDGAAPGLIEAARAHGFAGMARRLEAALASNTGEALCGLVPEHGRSYTLVPPLREVLRLELRSLRRTLGRRGRS